MVTEFVQSNLVAVPLNVTAFTMLPVQTVRSLVAETTGVGITVILCSLVIPGHTAVPVVLALACIVISDGEVELLVKTDAGIAPVPVKVVNPEIAAGTVADQEIDASDGNGVTFTTCVVVVLQIV